MTKENELDAVTNILKERMGEAKAEIKVMFKGANPYRQEPVPDKERITNYYDFLDDPEQEQQWRMDAGDEAVDKYHQDLRTLINRRMMHNA